MRSSSKLFLSLILLAGFLGVTYLVIHGRAQRREAKLDQYLVTLAGNKPLDAIVRGAGGGEAPFVIHGEAGHIVLVVKEHQLLDDLLGRFATPAAPLDVAKPVCE